DQDAIASRLHDPATVIFDRGVNEAAPKLLQTAQCSSFVLADEPAVPDHVSGHPLALIARKAIINQYFTWWSQVQSNPRPLECHSRALPAELWPRPRRAALGPPRPSPTNPIPQPYIAAGLKSPLRPRFLRR